MLMADDEEEDLKEYQNKEKKQERVEISCPIFLRPLMKQILSVGKTIKIIRYLENSNLLYGTKRLAGKESTLDHKGVDFQELADENMR